MLNRLFPRSRNLSTIEMGYWDHADSREVECLSGACIMARQEIIDTLRGFDEDYFMYAEDVDLCYRIRKESWKIYYLAEERIFHHEGASSKKKTNMHFSSLMQRASNFNFLKKNFGYKKALEFKVAVGVGSIIRLFALIILMPFLVASKRMSTDIFSKYFNLFLWSIGAKKHSSLIK